MQQRTLGSQGLRVWAVGLGCTVMSPLTESVAYRRLLPPEAL